MPEPLGKWLAVDPGEDTGWSLWQDDDLVDLGTAKMWEFGDAVHMAVFRDPMELELMGAELALTFRGLQGIVCEDWRIYPKEAKSGALNWDRCRTARLIGGLQLTARQGNLWFVLQPAAIKERALAAGAAHYFISPRDENRHANDSVMHGVYYRAVKGGTTQAITTNGTSEPDDEIVEV